MNIVQFAYDHTFKTEKEALNILEGVASEYRVRSLLPESVEIVSGFQGQHVAGYCRYRHGRTYIELRCRDGRNCETLLHEFAHCIALSHDTKHIHDRFWQSIFNDLLRVFYDLHKGEL